MAAPPPPTPVHLIRAHSHPLSALFVSEDNERIYSGDASGRVVVTSTRSLRALVAWNPHSDGLLGLQEHRNQIITHARDNKIHVWALPPPPAPLQLGASAAVPDLPVPDLLYSLDVNALNYCRFSLLSSHHDAFLLAVPNLVESSLADVWSLPSKERLHAAIGKPTPGAPAPKDGRGGIIMSMSLLPPDVPSSPSSSQSSALRLLAAYESGAVKLWTYDASKNEGRSTSIEGIAWQCTWEAKAHVESTMAMAVSRDLSFALSISADHLIGKYDLSALEKDPTLKPEPHRTKHPGNGSLAIHDAGRVCAVGGWDGRIRLYSTKTFKPLGTLTYHKDSVQALAFAHAQLRETDGGPLPQEDVDDDEDMTSSEKRARARWLVSGGKDGRVAIWELVDFSRR
ncbi:WD40 repeat-like protein [Amylostereum chailletii]|nr:WD40 repeat-like protein [Amylostereum chailletii]